MQCLELHYSIITLNNQDNLCKNNKFHSSREKSCFPRQVSGLAMPKNCFRVTEACFHIVSVRLSSIKWGSSIKWFKIKFLPVRPVIHTNSLGQQSCWYRINNWTYNLLKDSLGLCLGNDKLIYPQCFFNHGWKKRVIPVKIQCLYKNYIPNKWVSLMWPPAIMIPRNK